MFHRSLTLLSAALLPLAGTACSNDKPKEPAKTEAAPAPQPPPPLTVTESIQGTVTAKVKAVDYATRLLTLQDAQGHEETFVVDRAVTRLNEVKPGDEVKSTYKATLVAELRPPTAEESAAPIAMVEVAGRSPQGAAPAAGAAQAMRVVTTVEAVDLPNMRVTLRGPMGDVVVVRAKNPDNVKKLHVGDTIVITYTETVTIALEKIAPR